MAPTFLGPPELYQKADEEDKSISGSSADFMDLMVANFNNTSTPELPRRGETMYGSGTFEASGNPCVDLFFAIVPDTPADHIERKLVAAWSHDELTTLKLIFHLRGVRGAGKADREGFYKAALWLQGLHPKTLACNLAAVGDFGCYKDLPEILYRLLEGSEIREQQKLEWEMKKGGARRKTRNRQRYGDVRETAPFRAFRTKGTKKSKSKSKSRGEEPKKPSLQREIRIQNAEIRNKREKEIASLERHEKWNEMAKKVLERYNRDPDFKFLYDRISDHFAERLKSDLAHLNSGEVKQISLAAKWCPSIDSAFDRSTLLCEAIARKFFTRESFPEYDAVEEAHYGYRVRDRLRKEVLVPLRKALELPETYIGAKQWSEINYNRVSSVAMNLYKEKFLKHDEERFMKYLEDVKAGKATIAAGNVLPHEIIGSLRDSDDGLVAELQWKRMVDDLLAKGKLKNCIAICGVNSFMIGAPLEVSVSLGLLVSELSEAPWKGKIITFHETPELHVIQGSDLYNKTEFIRAMKWGQSTNFQKVFDLILKVAVAGKLKPEQMVKRVFVFSDMEFSQASANKWETDYECIQKKYKENGYESSVPEIVFWNLKDSGSIPVAASQKGVALASGFSENMMKLFLDSDGALDANSVRAMPMEPEAIMEAAIAGEEFKKLVVID